MSPASTADDRNRRILDSPTPTAMSDRGDPFTLTAKGVVPSVTPVSRASLYVSVRMPPSTVADWSCRPPAVTTAVGALVSVSSWRASSVKATLTLMALPTSPEVRVYVDPVAPGISASLASHWYWKTALSRPSASAMAVVSADSVCPTSGIPLICGSPSAGVFERDCWAAAGFV